MDEIELKFAVPAPALPALRKALRRGRARVERLQAAYFDTADGRLAAQHVSLRLRREGKRWVQTAKASADGPLRRLEHNAGIAAPADGAAPVLDIRRHDGTPAGKALRKALGRGGQAGLLLLFQSDVERTARIVRAGTARIEIALDEGTIASGASTLPVAELELELKAGAVGDLLRVASRWRADHGLSIATASKAERGALLARGRQEAVAVKATPPHFASGCGARVFFAATIASCLAQVLANAGPLAAGSSDKEKVHELRVGLRRLRTALRELGSLADGEVDPAWEQVLKAAFRELGEHRDRTVVLPQVYADVAAAGAPAFAERTMTRPGRSPEAIVRDGEFQGVLLALLGLGQGSAEDVAGRGDPKAFVARRLSDLRRRVGRDAKRFAGLATDRQHRVRKRLKRLRYLAEFAIPLFGRKEVSRYLSRWRRAQDALGEYNDLRIAADLFHATTDREPHAWFAVGWIAARTRAAIGRCQRALNDAARVRPFWAA